MDITSIAKYVKMKKSEKVGKEGKILCPPPAALPAPDAASHNPQGKTPLSEYTPRELIMELKDRGYKGRLVWQPPMPQPIVINIEEFN